MGLNFVPGFQPEEYRRQVPRGEAPGYDVSALRAGNRKTIIEKPYPRRVY